jgi:hypothetical protein
LAKYVWEWFLWARLLSAISPGPDPNFFATFQAI